jgi:hypothetical protein
MQVNSLSRIELIFADDYRYDLSVLGNCKKYEWSPDGFGTPTLFGKLVFLHRDPIAFIWHDSHLRKPSLKLIKWINEEFKPIFAYDPFKWFASVGTCSPELQFYLKDFYER